MPYIPRASDFRPAVGKRLAFWRKSKALTQKDLATFLGMHPNAWSRYETGEVFISPYNLVRIAETYGLDIHWLYTGAQAPAGPTRQQGQGHSLEGRHSTGHSPETRHSRREDGTERQ